MYRELVWPQHGSGWPKSLCRDHVHFVFQPIVHAVGLHRRYSVQRGGAFLVNGLFVRDFGYLFIQFSVVILLSNVVDSPQYSFIPMMGLNIGKPIFSLVNSHHSGLYNIQRGEFMERAGNCGSARESARRGNAALHDPGRGAAGHRGCMPCISIGLEVLGFWWCHRDKDVSQRQRQCAGPITHSMSSTVRGRDAFCRPQELHCMMGHIWHIKSIGSV